MKKQAIYGVSISFLDLLSGALAAVIILLVIVPKSNIQLIEEEAADVDLSINNIILIDSILQRLKDVIPAEEFEALMKASDEAKASMTRTKRDLIALKSSYNQRVEELQKLRKELEDKNQDLAAAKRKIDELERRVQDLTRRAGPAPDTNFPDDPEDGVDPEEDSIPDQPITPVTEEYPTTSRFVAMDIPFGVLVTWEDDGARFSGVDLYVVKDNQYCFPGRRTVPSVGRWGRLSRRHMSKGNNYVIQNRGLMPGEFEVFANIPKPRGNRQMPSMDIDLMLYFKHPETGRHQIAEFEKIRIDPSDPPNALSNVSNKGTLLGKLILREDGFDFERNF